MTDGKDVKPHGGPKGTIKDTLRAPLPKRFYKDVSLAPSAPGEPAGHCILLDGRAVRTPAKHLLIIPGADFARLAAAEWTAQQGVIDPASMPATRLANSAIDTVGPHRDEVAAEVASYAGSDLLCYRAEGPAGLVARQCEVWDAILDRVEQHLDVRFLRIEGVIHAAQPPRTLERVAASVAGIETFPLAAMQLITTLTGSALLAIALQNRLATAGEVWIAAHVDEDWQIAQWGEDTEATARCSARKRDFNAAAALLGCGQVAP